MVLSTSYCDFQPRCFELCQQLLDVFHHLCELVPMQLSKLHGESSGGILCNWCIDNF
jgi:hypothetical protein